MDEETVPTSNTEEEEVVVMNMATSTNASGSGFFMAIFLIALVIGTLAYLFPKQFKDLVQQIKDGIKPSVTGKELSEGWDKSIPEWIQGPRVKRDETKCCNSKCPNLGNPEITVKKCTQCTKVAYCTRECQIEDWKRHKLQCTMIKNNLTAAAAASDGEKPFPIYGVSLKWLLSDEISNRMLQVRTTRDAVEQVFLPMCEVEQSSVAEVLIKKDPKLVKAVADTYVAHVWSNDVQDLLQGLYNEFYEWCDEENNNDDIFIWIDFLCMNQYKQHNVLSDKFWDVELPTTMQSIGHFTLIMNNWKIASHLSRSWTLIEIILFYQKVYKMQVNLPGLRFRYGMKKTERDFLRQVIRSEPITNLFKMYMNQMNPGGAEAENPAIQEKILTLLKKTSQEIPEAIATSVRVWLLQEVSSVLEEMEYKFEAKNTIRGDDINETIIKQAELSEIAEMCSKLFWLLHSEHHEEEAEAMARKQVDIYESIFGTDHVKTAEARESIAVALSYQQKPAEAYQVLIEVVRVFKLLNNSAKTVGGLNNMGYVLMAQNMWEEACAPFKEALAILRKMHSNRPHPEVVQQLDQLANVLVKTDKLENVQTALAYLEEATGILKKTSTKDKKQIEERLKELNNGVSLLKAKIEEMKKLENNKTT